MEKYIFMNFNDHFILFYNSIMILYIDGDLKHFALVSVLIGEIMELSSAVTLIIANVYCSGRSRLPPIDFNYCNIQFIIGFSAYISYNVTLYVLSVFGVNRRFVSSPLRNSISVFFRSNILL